MCQPTLPQCSYLSMASQCSQGISQRPRGSPTPTPVPAFDTPANQPHQGSYLSVAFSSSYATANTTPMLLLIHGLAMLTGYQPTAPRFTDTNTCSCLRYACQPSRQNGLILLSFRPVHFRIEEWIPPRTTHSSTEMQSHTKKNI